MRGIIRLAEDALQNEPGVQNGLHLVGPLTLGNNMGDVVDFDRPGKGPRKAKSKGMCRHGFHKWQVVSESRFDVKQGKLVTVYRCERCGKQKITSH